MLLAGGAESGNRTPLFFFTREDTDHQDPAWRPHLESNQASVFRRDFGSLLGAWPSRQESNLISGLRRTALFRTERIIVPQVGVEPTPRRLRVWDASITPLRQVPTICSQDSGEVEVGGNHFAFVSCENPHGQTQLAGDECARTAQTNKQNKQKYLTGLCVPTALSAPSVQHVAELITGPAGANRTHLAITTLGLQPS